MLALSSTANAGITIPAGDWTLDIGGNVNTYYTNTRFTGDLKATAENAPRSERANQVSTGLLPSAIGFGGKTRQNDLDIAFQFTFFTGTNASPTGAGVMGNGTSNGADVNSLNIRQSYMSFGDASWGSVKLGRDLGVFGSDAILSDMTLLGVGQGAGGAGNSTLGRIGSGYIYADWVGQIQYTTPNWNGLQFTAAVREPWGNSSNNDLGYEGKATYDFKADEISGRVWVSGFHQRTQASAADAVYKAGAGNTTSLVSAATVASDNTVNLWDIGAKVNVGALGLVGYYYDGKNGGSGSGMLTSSWQSTGLFVENNPGKDIDTKGGYVQATYTIPAGTKLGASWGQSKRDSNVAGQGEFKDRSWIVGAYHPLTKSLNLVAEYTDTKLDNIGYNKTQEGKAKTVSLGAILFF